MPECQYCEADLDERYNFCLNCDRQVRCTNCRELLILSKEFCFSCGHPLVAHTVTHNHANRFTLEEEQTESSARRRIEGSLSDEAFREAAAMFVGLTQRRIGPHTPSPQQPAGTVELPSANTPETEQASGNGVTGHEPPDEPKGRRTSPSESDPREEALEYFRLRGDDDVTPQEPGFKGKTKKEQQERFILLYAWAYRSILDKAVQNREQINEAARIHKIFDRNLPTYLTGIANQYLVDTGDGLELNRRGKAAVSNIIKEMNDPSVEEGSPYWEVSNAPAAKRSRLSKEDREEVARWVQMPLEEGELDIRALNSATNYAMFAVWAITKHLKVTSAVKPLMAYEFLTEKYKEVSVAKRTFQNVLSEKKKKFRRNSEGSYFLTSEAQQEVEAWVQTGQVDGSTS